MGGRGSNNNERLERGGRSTTGGKLKWTKRNDQGAGALGQGYQSGDYVIKETYKSAELQRQNGGKISDYYWELTENGKVLKYAKTAKALKEYAETLSGPAKNRTSGTFSNPATRRSSEAEVKRIAGNAKSDSSLQKQLKGAGYEILRVLNRRDGGQDAGIQITVRDKDNKDRILRISRDYNIVDNKIILNKGYNVSGWSRVRK